MEIDILADKYDLQALMELAEKRFKSSLSLGLTEEDYRVYTSPVPINGLKAINVAHARRRFWGTLQVQKSSDVFSTIITAT